MSKSVLYINTDGMRKTAQSVKDGQGTRVGTLAKMLIDCCEHIDRLASEPEPTESTKGKRWKFKNFQIHNENGESIALSITTSWGLYFTEQHNTLCDKIDRLTAENSKLKDYERKLEANEVVSALQVELKTKNETFGEILTWTGPTIKSIEGDNKTTLIGRLRNIYKLVEQALKGTNAKDS